MVVSCTRERRATPATLALATPLSVSSSNAAASTVRRTCSPRRCDTSAVMPERIARYRNFSCVTCQTGACYCKSTCDRSTNMNASAPRTAAVPPFGYHQFHRDVGLNYECNRWAESIGPEAIGEITRLAAHANTYPEWIDGYLALADQARAGGREFAAAIYDRAAEFFISVGDPRRPAARSRYLQTMRTTYGVGP